MGRDGQRQQENLTHSASSGGHDGDRLPLAVLHHWRDSGGYMPGNFFLRRRKSLAALRVTCRSCWYTSMTKT